MTWSKGSQWKTSWSRRGHLGIQRISGQMWFFNLRQSPDVWRYIAPLASPFPFADPPPFWFGYVWRGANAVNGAGMRFGESPQAADGVRGEGISVVPANDPSVGRMETGGYFAPSLFVDTPSLEYLPGQVVVVLGTVTQLTVPNQVNVKMFVDRTFAGQATYDGVYGPQTSPFFFEQVGIPNSPCVHGFVAGAGTPSGEQIAQWFDDTKANLEIAEIAGMTTDRWSATSAQPAVPNPLPNLATGQDLTLVSIGVPAAPTNSQISAYFTY